MKPRRLLALFKSYADIIITSVLATYIAIIGWNYYDVSYFIGWYNEYFKTGRLLEVYTSDLKVAYPPLAVILFVSTHAVAVHFFGENIIAARLIDKIPLLASFIAVYFILRRNVSRLASYLWLLTFEIYNVILSYQFDPLASLFLLLALLSFERGKYGWGGLYIALASLFKQVLGILLVIPMIYLYRGKESRELVKLLSVVSVVVAIVVMPFLMASPLAFIDKIMFYHAKRPPQYLSLWAIPIYASGYDQGMIDLSQQISSYWIIFFLVYIVMVCFYAYREAVGSARGYYVKHFTLLTIGLLLFNKVGNTNYFLWLAPLLIVFISRIGNSVVKKRLVFAYVFTSLLIGVLFGFLSGYVHLIAGIEYIFIFEDFKWIPSQKFLYDCIGSDPFNLNYRAVLYLHSINAVREGAASLAVVHHYLIVCIIIVYVVILVYFIKSLYKYGLQID
ncbi:MAG: hypothetical protein LM589_05350 [Thermosphaera sp.]|nr:hypothetical protein [Thermosphaera sp.]